LSNISDPRAKLHRLAVDMLFVMRGNRGGTFASDVLLEGGLVDIEPGGVVHKGNTSS